MTKEEIKAMEEVAKRRLGCYVMDDRYRQLYGRREALYEAMSEYATQCTAPLEARIRDLEEGLREFVKFYKLSSNGYPVIGLQNAYKNAQQFLSSSSSDGWIRLEKRLSEANLDVLVIHNDRQFNTRRIGRLDTIMPIGSTMPLKPIFCLDDGIYTPKVTHWRPLPALPSNL